jgi:hypothetical protein
MSTPRTTAVRTASVVALLAAAGFAGCSGDAEAAPAPASESCGDPIDRGVEWPAELSVGTRLVSDSHTSYLVQTDCGVLTLVRSDDPGSCWYMTGYGLQRYPC